MTPKAARVFRGFTEISDAERAELIEEINKYQQGGSATREVLKRDVGELVKRSDTTVNFGPIPGGCPCCGR